MGGSASNAPVFSDELEINDLPPHVRYRMTKGETQKAVCTIVRNHGSRSVSLFFLLVYVCMFPTDIPRNWSSCHDKRDVSPSRRLSSRGREANSFVCGSYCSVLLLPIKSIVLHIILIGILVWLMYALKEGPTQEAVSNAMEKLRVLLAGGGGGGGGGGGSAMGIGGGGGVSTPGISSGGGEGLTILFCSCSCLSSDYLRSCSDSIAL